MVSMVIVDDEPLMRRGLESLDWGSIDVQVVGVVSNGLDALTLIRKHRPELLFTDIKMPGIDGLQLIEMARQLREGIRSVILTGYSEFEYARRAITLGVDEYILKPCDPVGTLETISRVARSIEQGADRREAAMEAASQTRIEDCLRSCLTGLPTQSGSEGLLKAFASAPLIVALLMFREPKLARDLQRSIDRILKKETMPAVWEVMLEGTLTALVFRDRAKTRPDFEDDVSRVCYHALKSLDANDLRLGISSPRTGACQLREGFLEAQKCLSLLFSQRDLCLYRYSNYAMRIAEPVAPVKLIQQILTNFEMRNYAGTDEGFDRLRDHYRENPVEECFIKYVVIDICRSTQFILSHRVKAAASMLTMETYLDINAAATLDDLIDYAKRFLHANIDAMQQWHEMPAIQLDQQIDSFIREHYREDVGLTELARCLHLNPDYLGRLIRRHFDTTFGQLLLNARLEKACELLADPSIPIASVAESVGIGDCRYFSQLFKARYTSTPSEYRKNTFMKIQQGTRISLRNRLSLGRGGIR